MEAAIQHEEAVMGFWNEMHRKLEQTGRRIRLLAFMAVLKSE